jgi:hypothetical protein
MRSLRSYVSVVRQRAVALFRRADQPDSGSAERRRAWSQAIAEHRKPPERAQDPEGTTPTS